jgi:hypothetical protein
LRSWEKRERKITVLQTLPVRRIVEQQTSINYQLKEL